MQMNFIVLLIGLLFAPLAGLMAFLVTYGEYSHHYADRKEPLKFAIAAAVFTFLVFGLMFFAISFIIPKF